jgi:hypothetical protein
MKGRWPQIGLIKRLDSHWLRHHPLLWASRLHYVICAELAVLVLMSLLTTFLPISFTNIPNAYVLTLYNIGLQSTLFFIWLYFQRMIDIRYFHADRIRFFEIKTTMIFFMTAAFIGACAFVPSSYLTYRVIDTLEDENFKTVESLLPSDINRKSAQEYVDVDSIGPDNSSGPIFNDRSRPIRKYLSLETKSKFNVFVALNGEILYSDFYNVEFSEATEETGWISWLTYDPRSNPGLLKIFYDKYQEDSIYSKKFKKVVCHRRFQAQFTKTGSTNVQDTTIDRYYFISSQSTLTAKDFAGRVDQAFSDIKVGDQESISEIIFGDMIMGELRKKYSLVSDEEFDSILESTLANFKSTTQSWMSSNEWKALLLWLLCAVPVLFLMTNSIIRLFNYRVLFIGLTAPIIAIAVLGALFFLLDTDYAGVAFYIFLGLFALLICLFVNLFRRTMTNILFLQFAMSQILVGCLSIPFFYAIGHMFSSDDGADLVPLMFWSVIVLFISACFYLRRLYSIYAHPYR